MELLPDIPEDIKIGAIWGEQDGITPSTSKLAGTISECS